MMYLDCNAHQPMSPVTMQAYLLANNDIGNPLSPHCFGRSAALKLETARSRIAELIGCESNQLLFTSGATKACNWCCEMMQGQSDPIKCFPFEHPAVIESYEHQFDVAGYTETDRNGIIDAELIYQNIICCYVQPEIGTIQPLQNLKKKLLFSDMTAALGKIPIDLSFVDLAAFGAHKFGGPTGVGFVYLRDPALYRPSGTGSRYFKDYPGTPNVAGAVATAAALEEAINTLPERTYCMNKFRAVLEPGLEQLGFCIIGKDSNRCPSTTFVGGFNGLSLNVLMDLSAVGICVGLGSACGSLHTNVNRTMKLLRGDTCGYNYLRISQWGQYNDQDAVIFLAALEKVWKRYKNNSAYN